VAITGPTEEPKFLSRVFIPSPTPLDSSGREIAIMLTRGIIMESMPNMAITLSRVRLILLPLFQMKARKPRTMTPDPMIMRVWDPPC